MRIGEIFRGWNLNDGSSQDLICNATKSLKFTLPSDYIELLCDHDGGEGFIGDNYLMLWKSEELAVFNEEYEVEKYAPGIFLFGSNGGGESYGFDLRDPSMPIVRIPFVGMDLRYARTMATNFTDFLIQLAK